MYRMSPRWGYNSTQPYCYKHFAPPGLAPLFSVSPTQVNYLVPEDVPEGQAEITITNTDNGQKQRALISVVSTAPSIFTANANGMGVPAAYAVRAKSDGSQLFEPVVNFDSSSGKFTPAEIDLGPDTDSVFLVLFGTGFRNRTSLENVVVYIGGAKAQAFFAARQGDFDGLDQLNVLVPRSLMRKGEVDVLVTVEGKVANPVKVKFK